MDKNPWVKWGISGALALAGGRAAVLGSFYPGPAALLAVTVTEKYCGWKLVLLSGAGLWLARRTSTAVFADMAAAAAVWLALVLLRGRKPAPVSRAVVGAAVWMAAKSMALRGLRLSWRYGLSAAVSEGMLIVGLAYIFFKLYAFIQAGKIPLSRPEAIAVVVVTAAVLVRGMDSGLLKTAMFLVTLWIAHGAGAKEGAVAGVCGGTILWAMTAVSPTVTTILACGGLVAGLCTGEAPVLAAFAFSAVTLLFGLAQGMASLYIPVYVPLLASVLFLVRPAGLVKIVNRWIVLENTVTEIGSEHAMPCAMSGEHVSLSQRQTVLRTLDRYRETFEYLSRAYILQRESFHEEPRVRSGRMIMAYQFKGMADAVGKLAAEIRTPALLAAQGEERFRVTVGKAGFAREGKVSGDSVRCGEIRRGSYAVALSDGMGGGRRAAEESNLTVQTIHRLLAAGFQPELALRIMNSILLYRAAEEIYSTLDLALFDLKGGQLQLYKIGGSLTILKRGDKVEVVKIPALPMGIVGDIDVPSVNCRLKTGDQIILLSDGIAEAGRTGSIQWLMEAIGQLRTSDPQTVADLLVNKAVERCGIKEKDDMTAVVVVVH